MNFQDKIHNYSEAEKVEIAKNAGIEVIEKNGIFYYRINLDDIDTSKMSAVRRVRDIIAFEVNSGLVFVSEKTSFNKDFLNKNHFIVCYITYSDKENLSEKIIESPKNIIPELEFNSIFNTNKIIVKFNNNELENLRKYFSNLNNSNPDFNTDFLKKSYRYTIFGKRSFAAKINFNAVITLKNGQTYFLGKGDAIIHNPDEYEKYGREKFKVIEGGTEGKASEFERNYGIPPQGSDEQKEEQAKGVISDTFKNVIKCDRSPVAGIQFNNIQLAEAYEKIGKVVPRLLERYLKD